MAYSIRAADSADLPSLTSLYLEYGKGLQKCGLQYEINADALPAVLTARIKSRLFFVGVALCDGNAEGFIICSLAKIGREYRCEGSGQVGYLNDVYVRPTLRRTGCANALLAAAKNWLKDCGVNTLELEVLSGNTDGKLFWEKAGGREIARFYQIKL